MPEKFFSSPSLTLYGSSLRSRGNFFLRDRWGVIGEFAIDTHGERDKTFIVVTVDQKSD